MANLGQISDDAKSALATDAMDVTETLASGDTSYSDDPHSCKTQDAAGIRTGGRTVVFVG